MYEKKQRLNEQKGKSVSNEVFLKKSNTEPTFQLVDNRSGVRQSKFKGNYQGIVQLGQTKEEKKAAEKARRDKQAAAAAASKQKAKETPEAKAKAAADDKRRESKAALGAKKTQEAGERAKRLKTLVHSNDQLIDAAKQQVLNARQTKGQEHFNAGNNPGIPAIPGGTNNPIGLNRGQDNFPLTQVATNLVTSVSGIASRHFSDGANPTIIIHVV